MSIACKNKSFKAILNVLKPFPDLDQAATDLHFFFKRSAAHREDYKMIENIMEVTTHCRVRISCLQFTICEAFWQFVNEFLHLF